MLWKEIVVSCSCQHLSFYHKEICYVMQLILAEVICCHRFCLILQTFNLLLYYDFPLIYICLFAFILFNIRTSLECANILYFTFIFFLFVFVSQSVHIKVYRPVPVHITFQSRFTIMTSNLFSVSLSLYFGRKLSLFLEVKYNITNSSRHFGPNGPQYHEIFVKYELFSLDWKN